MKCLIKDLGKVSTGNTPSKKEEGFYDSDDIGFVKPDIISDSKITYVEDTQEYLSENARKKARIVPANSVFVTCIGSIGKIGIAKNREFAFNQQINAIEPNEKVFPEYLAYCLMYNKKQLTDIANAPVVPIINKTQFESFEISIEEDVKKQAVIVGILNQVIEIIHKRQQQLEQLELLIQSRFVEMFGDPMDESKTNATFTEVVEFNPKKSEVSDMQDTEVSFVPMDHVGVDGSFKEQRTGLISEFYKGYTYFREGDVLIAKITPCFENGKSAIAHDCCNGIGFGTTEFHVARPIEGRSTAEWVKYLLKNDNLHEYASSKMTGSAGQKRIQTPFFENLKVYLPALEEQQAFSDFVKQVEKSKIAVQKALDETQLLFDSLMQEYFG